MNQNRIIIFIIFVRSHLTQTSIAMPVGSLESDEGWITVRRSGSTTCRLLVIILAVSIPLCVMTWYFSKWYYEGIHEQQVLEKLQRKVEKPYPLWMYLTLTSMIIVVFQCTQCLREWLIQLLSQRRIRGADPRTVESIRHPNDRDINSMLWFRK